MPPGVNDEQHRSGTPIAGKISSTPTGKLESREDSYQTAAIAINR
jgi:hypothetical protein